MSRNDKDLRENAVSKRALFIKRAEIQLKKTTTNDQIYTMYEYQYLLNIFLEIKYKFVGHRKKIAHPRTVQSYRHIMLP